MKKKPFEGVATALYTPLTCDGEKVDFDALSRLIERQIAAGISALVVCGSTGEAATLSLDELKSVTEFTVAKVNERIPVIAGWSSNCTERAKSLAKEAAAIGVDALLCATPYFVKCNQTGILRHYAAVASATDLPVIVYDVPHRTGVEIKIETYLRLCRVDTVSAVKYAIPSISGFSALIENVGDLLPVYCGADEVLPDVLRLGASGTISAASNVIPHKIIDIYNKKRDFYETEKAFVDALSQDVNPIGLKYAVKRIFGEGYGLRLPLTSAEKNQRTAIDKALKRLSEE